MATSTAPWVGQILHIDLSSGKVSTLPTLPYAEHYLGGRGLAIRLAWDMLPPGIMAFDPANALFFMPGCLVGTPAPSAGRVTICGLSPQGYPDEWYTRSNLGGQWGPELKYAGYDGLVVTGKAPQPVYIQIEDDRVEILDAAGLWGHGLVETQKLLNERLGPGWRTLAIGPAGEHRVRYAIVATNTESAAGQGGFGAVMGSKNLKAIAVRGHGGVPVADPQEALRRSRLVVGRIIERYNYHPPKGRRADVPHDDKRRLAPCTYQCPRSCGEFFEGLPGTVHPERTYNGHWHCCSPNWAGRPWMHGEQGKPGQEGGFEITQISNDLGLNHWEFAFGIGPWFGAMLDRGETLVFDGEKVTMDDAAWWIEFLDKIAYRRGIGDVFAEGAQRAAKALGIGEDLVDQFYPGWGQASHWDGHGSFGGPYWPFWLVTSLQWAMDTRDPMGGGHDYTINIFGPANSEVKGGVASPDARRRWLAMGQHLYGTPDAVDPLSSYGGKAAASLLHQDAGGIKDSLGLCDNTFPMLTDPNAEDFIQRVDGVEGRYFEHYLFEPASDLPISREDFYRVGARIYTLERMIAHRNWNRTRATDETIIPYLMKESQSVNPAVGHKVEVDPARYRAMMDEYYRLRGWDVSTGRPLPETLRALGLDEL